MMKKLVLIIFFFATTVISGQEIGSNFNHNPEYIDLQYLEKVKVDWIRATPRILDYVYGDLKVKNDPGLEKLILAGEKGYKIAFGFRWDFKKLNKSIPRPGSEQEALLFGKVEEILGELGPYIDIFKLGNEPNLETLDQDMERKPNGSIPLVLFTKRLLTEVIEPFYQEHPKFSKPDIYVGSFPRLFMEEVQLNDAVRALIEFTDEDPRIKGLAIHLHISEATQIVESFEFVRTLMPEKPIIVPEFSFHRLYTSKLNERITKTNKGKAFAIKYKRDPEWKLYDWFGYANTQGVSRKEWKDLFDSLEWFPQHSLLTFYESFRKYGVVLATYPLFQQSAPKNMTTNSPAWFINPIFGQKSLLNQKNGEFSSNPLHFEDFLEVVNRGKNKKSNKK